MTDAKPSLEARIDRLESIDAIRQLAAKYSLALDMRDCDAWANLFPEDVKVGGGKTGRAELRRLVRRNPPCAVHRHVPSYRRSYH